ncbi:DUF333 domain-containing protein [Acuticoccus sp. I52.16.1]|uniref:putative hemolysin n=1 Tax=Acuticoccus sp. I52.16.1 TaxID=2928472 RepID=UPI001FD5C874|nr:DUF333 domain-containing protein [Acuticoccus sp. I52.16.1]UOM34952.1 DUF333 domain-containing protein [Acuticoccus sp. I52.16.1]
MSRLLVLVALLPLAAHAAEGDAPVPGATGLANPASEYCASRGGTVVIEDEADGQVGYCHLPDGRVVEEWDLYRAEHR